MKLDEHYRREMKVATWRMSVQIALWLVVILHIQLPKFAQAQRGSAVRGKPRSHRSLKKGGSSGNEPDPNSQVVIESAFETENKKDEKDRADPEEEESQEDEIEPGNENDKKENETDNKEKILSKPGLHESKIQT